jgi:hypothetical protein
MPRRRRHRRETKSTILVKQRQRKTKSTTPMWNNARKEPSRRNCRWNNDWTFGNDTAPTAETTTQETNSTITAGITATTTQKSGHDSTNGSVVSKHWFLSHQDSQSQESGLQAANFTTKILLRQEVFRRLVFRHCPLSSSPWGILSLVGAAYTGKKFDVPGFW